MTIRILTSGAIGFEDLRTKLQAERDYTVYDLDALCSAADQKHWPEFYEDKPFLLVVKPEFSRDDLKSATDDSVQLQRYLAVLAHIVPMLAIDGREHVVLGREHGLGFVPMITVQRETIRRETKILSALVPYASSYHISFAGDTRLTVMLRD